MSETNQLDSLGVGTALTLFSEQIKNTYEQAITSNIEKLEFDNVVVSGMGGSSNAGKIIQSLIEGTSKKGFFVFNDYGLPNWVNEKTLVVLNSYSGNTEETLSAYEIAKKNNCQIIGVTKGGKLAEMISSGEIKGAIVDPKDTNPTGYPKAGLGVSFGALFGALTKVGLLTTTKEELYASLDEVTAIRESWDAIEMAKWLDGALPILFVGRTLLGPLNAARNAMCEISRNFTQYYDFPEVNHVLIEATQKPELVTKSAKYLFFESEFDYPRITTRFEVTKKIFDEQGLTYRTCTLKGKSLLTQCLELPHYGAWVGYHLSLAQNTDPGPEPWIIKLKVALDQPVH